MAQAGALSLQHVLLGHVRQPQVSPSFVIAQGGTGSKDVEHGSSAKELSVTDHKL